MVRENSLDTLREEVRLSSLGGFPMLITAACAWPACAALSFVLPPPFAAAAFLFQGVVTMPVGLWLLPRRLGLPTLPRTHPLTLPLVLAACVQTLALPAVIAVFTLKPQLVPMAFAAVMGGHFLPYWWLQRCKAYLWGALLAAVGPWAITTTLGATASFHYTGFYLGAVLAWLAITVRAEVRAGRVS